MEKMRIIAAVALLPLLVIEPPRFTAVQPELLGARFAGAISPQPIICLPFAFTMPCTRSTNRRY